MQVTRFPTRAEAGYRGFGRWLVPRVRTYLIPVWFGVFALVHVLDIVPEGRIGFDARIYHLAGRDWLEGGNPWASGIALPSGRFHFAGLPPTVVVFATLSWIPANLVGPLFSVMCAFTAIWVLRRLHLGWQWALFPPLVQGVLLGQPGILVLGLLLSNHTYTKALAIGLKVYAAVPLILLWRGRPLLWFGTFCLASMFVHGSLWLSWIEQSSGIASRLIEEVGGGVGATTYIWLVPITVAALAAMYITNRDAAAWLAVPALWPSAQYHYPVMALPVIRLVPALLFSVPVAGMSAIAVVAHAYLGAREARIERGDASLSSRG